MFPRMAMATFLMDLSFYEIPSPLPHQLHKPARRLLAEDAHLMPTVPAESALAEIFRASIRTKVDVGWDELETHRFHKQ